jgi:diguanylate cyclase (GGDEF)-like protein/PAS domain S-box-containing protein
MLIAVSFVGYLFCTEFNISEDIQTFKFTQQLLTILVLTLVIIIGVLLLRYNVRRIKNTFSLKMSEENVLKSQKQLLNVINGAKLGYWDLDYKTSVLIVNDEWLSILGLSRQNITNHLCDWQIRLHPDDKAYLEKMLNTHIQSGTNYVAEFRMKHADGSWIWIQGSGSVVESDEQTNEPLRLCGTHQDITERKQAEDALRESEATVRKKLKAILEPDTEINDLELSDIIDAEVLQPLMDDFYHLTGMLGAVLDIKGNILVSVGWQDICTKFHRCHPDTLKNCIESDTVLTQGVEHGTYKAYKCKNNMWDLSTPIIIGGKHIGNVFIGQFFYKDEVPDVGLFKNQAQLHGFDELIYLQALDKVPRFTRDEVAKAMSFYSKLADIISTLSFSTIQQSKLLAERKLSDKKLELAASVFTHACESIVITDTKGNILEVNDTFSKITGFSREESMGKNPRILQSGRQSSEFYVGMWKDLVNEGFWTGEMWNRRKNGEVYAEMKTISAVRDEQGITTHYVALANDITVMKQHQHQLEHVAHYDILTNLPNRVLLADRLSQAKLHCKRNGKTLAVTFLDLDGFKTVNDIHGHDVGDELLIALSLRMKKALREGDTLARIGGDEFVAILTDLNTVEDCEPVLKRFLLAASEPVTIGDVVINVSASIGVTLYPQDNVSTDQLMRHADQAMYVAKESGKNRYHLFDTVQDDAVKVQRESLEAIRRALDNHQFVLYYQPKVNMRTGSVTGAEALIRWQHPERGLLNPLEFLPVIENNPMMIELGEWVIDTALTQISQWQAMDINLPLNISVNIAALQLQQPDFMHKLTTLLAAHPDVEPHYLELEVLETSALEDVYQISTMMNACIALGVKFSLDDFGTGYSSLTYLRRLPASLIKIDQTFVREMLNDADDLAIVEGVIALAKSFKRDVIAEGVETIEHGTALLKLGCELAQGYGIARPMPASNIPMWISDWKPDVNW